MRIEVLESGQVREFVSGIPPEPRKKLRAAIHALAEGKGDVKPLVDELAGYIRLRVGRFRVIFFEAVRNGRPIKECIFVERRDVVYELFRRMVLDDVS